jgi:hypothetical protein
MQSNWMDSLTQAAIDRGNPEANRMLVAPRAQIPLTLPSFAKPGGEWLGCGRSLPWGLHWAASPPNVGPNSGRVLCPPVRRPAIVLRRAPKGGEDH